MSDAQRTIEPAEPAEPAAGAWRWPSPSRADAAVNGALAGVLLVAGLVLGGSDPVDELPAPPVKADPVRVGPLISAFPPDCGVSPATLDALVPHPEVRSSITGQSCTWGTADRREDRRLDVAITLVTDARQGTAVAPASTPVTGAMTAFSDQSARRQGEGWKVVGGLGDEAVARYSPDGGIGGGSILVRARNAVVRVAYSGRDGPSREQLPERAAMEGVRRAAVEVVRGLGVAADRPVVVTGRDAGAAPAPRPRDPCAMVSGDTLGRLLDDPGKGTATDGDPAGERESTATCRWEDGRLEGNYTYYLQVSLTAYPDVASARRGYLRRHLEARAEEPISEADERYFTALAGPGEQAYASFTEEGLPGGVVFQARDIVVTVAYSQSEISNAPPGDSGPLTRERSVNGAYAAATDVAGALRG